MKITTSANELLRQLKPRWMPFFAVFFVVVFVTYAILFAFDFYPEPATDDVVPETTTQVVDATVPASNSAPASLNETPEPDVTPVGSPYPLRLTFDTFDRSVAVRNPESAENSVLDEALRDGVARHPHSADLVDTGNMLILGHSSYLPNVFNRNFQAFNGIENLKWGDLIRLTSSDTEYVYRVNRVYHAPASDIFVPVGEETTPKLTLVTCNVLGAKEDRYVLEASLVDTVALTAGA